MKFSFQKVISGAILTNGWFRRQYKLMLLICGLIFCYIYSGYQSQVQQKQLSDLQKELQDVQLIHLTISSELMDKTRQSSIAAMLQEKGSNLTESVKPATRIQ